MVEGGRLPTRSGVAQFASLSKSARYVVGIRRPLKIRQVAGNARRAADVVVAEL